MSTRLLLPVGGLIAAALAVAFLVAGGDASRHRLSFVIPDAVNIIPGTHVRAAGQRVGTVTDVRTAAGGRAARVDLEVTDENVWPLTADARVRLRFGGTVAYASRSLAIVQGVSTKKLADGATIPPGQVEVPVEFDALFNTFGPRTRQNLRRTVNAAGAALKDGGPALRAALDVAPDAVGKGRAVFTDLTAESPALRELVTSSDRVVHAANAANPGLSSLITDASTTFAALGDRAAALQQLITRLPRTLVVARGTLQRADRTLKSANDLASRLDPGVDALTAITPALNRTLRTLRDVAPPAAAAMTTVRGSTSALTAFVNRTTALMPTVDSVATQAKPQVRCLRPYAPEIAGFASTWSSFVSVGDGHDKIARLYNSVYPFPNDTPIGTGAASKLVPAAFESYAFPRPPGANVNQPWYQPECGITKDGLDPTKNPEDLPANARGAKPVEKGR